MCLHGPAAKRPFVNACSPPQVSNIYMIKPVNLRRCCEEKPLSRIPKSKLMVFLRQRADYRSANIADIFSY